jgi:alpha-amylase
VVTDFSSAALESAIFDEALNHRYFRKVAHWCYHPAVGDFAAHLDCGLKLNIGFSFSFLRQAEAWDPALLAKLRQLVGHPNVELIGVEPYHSFLFWLDLDLFRRRMAWARDTLGDLFGKPVQVTDTTEMTLSPDICAAVESLGFRAVFAEGRRQLLDWRDPTYLYVQPGHDLKLLPRHNDLSDDVGYRFSDTGWDGYPLKASDFARWVRDAPGDLVVLGWDFETFGEHHPRGSGIFEFLRWLPGELDHHGVTTLTASEALNRFGSQAHSVEVPVSPTTWAGQGDMSFFLGNPVQQEVYNLMRHAYNLAVLTDEPALIDIALWLCQSDNLHVLMWYDEFSAEAEVAAYFTPDEWWRLGYERLLVEMKRVYENFIGALSHRLAWEPAEAAARGEAAARSVRSRGWRGPGAARSCTGSPAAD